MAIRLKGLTWDDPRGRGPMPALSKVFMGSAAGRGVEIEWTAQPLSGFESAPVGRQARDYDVLVIDHPHVIEAAGSGAIASLEMDGDDCYAGPSLASYRWRNRVWAVPVDAAAHVAAYGPRWQSKPAKSWAMIYRRVHDGLRCGLPLRGVHALMAVLTLLASSASAPESVLLENLPGLKFASDNEMAAALLRLRGITAISVPESRAWNPIEALTALAEGVCDCVPMTFGYAHFQSRGVRFASVPTVVNGAPPRPIRGGAGIAVSALRPHRAEAEALAWLAGSEAVQSGLWAKEGGQPAHRDAWRVLARSQPFYRDTLPSLEHAYVRPRCLGWNRFQSAAGDAINEWLGDPKGNAYELAARVREMWEETTSEAAAVAGIGEGRL